MKRPLLEKGIDIFIRYNEAISIFRKVQTHNEKSFSNLISSRKPFGFATSFKGNPKPYKNINNVTLFQTKGVGYIRREDISQNSHWIDEHKVLAPYAIGSGNSKTDKVNPIYAKPDTACTETYLVIGPFKDRQRCENVISYIETKFFHFMLTLRKNTQHTTKSTYQFVPQQDFSKPWTDEELYKKYGLSEEEISYIESMVRPMD
ncbi:hypothetical protein ACQ1Q5_02180 [Ornithobacterium rhinotracheale]